MKQKTLLIMTLLSTLLGCGNKISGPDFEHQENKVISLNEKIRLDYLIPGNLSHFMNFSEEHKKQPKSINLSNINNLDYLDQDWRKSYVLDIGKWEYYKGKRNIESNRIADLSLNVDIHQSTTDNLMELENTLKQTYQKYLNGDNGINTMTRKDHSDYTDNELGDLIVALPEFKTININGIEFLHWHTYGEVRSWNLQYFIKPLDKNHYLAIYFRYYFSVKNEKELNNIEPKLENDIMKFMEQIQISKL